MELTQYEEVPPDPSAMIESMRAYGYNLATAIADLIDNSIAARASNVWVRMEWNGEDSWISVADDGGGMGQEELRNAMRLGSTNPLLERRADDLGRFGLGLKTASLSQCRRLSIRSRRNGLEEWTRRWDLDYLARPEASGWRLLLKCAEGSEERLILPHRGESGTIVLWERMDRIVGDAGRDDRGMQDHWHRLAEELEEHLSMVFHRFLEASARDQRVHIFLNGNKLEAWNPFEEGHAATELIGQETLEVPGSDGGRVEFRGYVLPHKDKLGPELHQALRGPKGWNAQQGFYLYRNRRLIVSGTWLGLGGSRPWTQEEHYKLARIRLDIPNSMDQLWQLDVKKSSASPPPQLSKALTGLAQTVRNRARAVFAHRAQHGSRPAARQEIERPWRSVKQSGGRSYRIDRKHSFIRAVMDAVSDEAGVELEAMLRILEETVPVEQIWLDKAEHPEEFNTPFYGTAGGDLKHVIVVAYKAVRRNRGLSHEEAIKTLLTAQEFNSDECRAIIATLET